MPTAARSIGIDIGGTRLRAACVDGDGTASQAHSEIISRAPEAVIERVIALCRACDGPEVIGIGLGIPGRVDAARRAVLSGGFVDLSETRIADRLEDALGKPVVIENDCTMALRAEMAWGAARGVPHVAMLTIGTGIGGALALDGAIVRGVGTAGQLGHVTVDPDGLPCLCGRHGCVETTSSGTALGRLIGEAGLPAETRIEILLAEAEAGDPRTAAIVRAWAAPLRAALDTIAASVAPTLVVLGGGLGAAATAALRLVPVGSPWFRYDVAAARLGDEAGVLGAGLAALQAAEHRPPQAVGARP